MLPLPLVNVVKQRLYEDDSVNWSRSSTLECRCEEQDHCKVGWSSQNCHFVKLWRENLCSKLSPFGSHLEEENFCQSEDIH